MQELVIIARIFSGVEIALNSSHWHHTGSPAYYNFIRKIDSSDEFVCKFYLLSPTIIGSNKRREILFDNLSTVAKIIPYYSFPLSKYFPFLKKIEFFYNKIRQYSLILMETRHSQYYYIDRDNILLSFILLVTSKSSLVFTRLLGVTEGLYKHLTCRNNIYSRIIRWTFGNNRAYFICTNDGSFSELVQRNIGHDRFHLLFNGVNKSFLPVLRSNFNKYNEQIIISYVSRIALNKGHINFINSLNKVVNHDNLVVYIVGDGDLRGQCQDLVNKYRLNDTVFFTGSVSHKEAMKYLANSHILIYINYDGSFGNSILEAAQLGLPIVTLKHTGVSSRDYPFFEFIDNDFNIEDNLTNFIEKFIIKKNALYASMSKKSINFSRNYLVSWDDRIDAELDIIKSICKSKK